MPSRDGEAGPGPGACPRRARVTVGFFTLGSIGLLLFLGGCPTRAPSPTTTAPAVVASGTRSAATDAAELPCPSLANRHSRALAEASRSCQADHDCTCVDRPPFLDGQVVVARSVASDLQAIAAAFHAAGCPPITVSQPAAACRPMCRKGQCASK